MVRASKSSARSATFPSLPTSPKTNITSAGLEPTLWQTSMLRGSRLKVVDEVANGLSYYDYTFLRELPRFYAALEDQLASTDPAWDGFELPSFLRVGSWIGGDRDGNPFVTADVLRQSLGMQSERALKFYLDEVHLLGGELSLDARLVP